MFRCDFDNIVHKLITKIPGFRECSINMLAVFLAFLQTKKEEREKGPSLEYTG